MQKTGCSHIRRILSDVLTGEFCGKHNRIPERLKVENKHILGSIRNPWEWYVSLWAYGCGNNGAIYNEVTRQPPFKLRGLGWKKNPVSAFQGFLSSLSNNSETWRRVYRDSNDAGAFRDWLQMMNDPKFYYDFGEGYAASPLSTVAGIMTFRYLGLFCMTAEEPKVIDVLPSSARIREFEENNCFVEHFIRNESLETDLISALISSGVNIVKEDREKIMSLPSTNTSSRHSDIGYYYDRLCAELIAEREQLIIDKFNYSVPKSLS